MDTVARTPQQLGQALRFGTPELDDDFRLSIAGAQDKTALTRRDGRWYRPHRATPSTHILKLPRGMFPGGIDPRTPVENEWLCAQHAPSAPTAPADTEPRFRQ